MNGKEMFLPHLDTGKLPFLQSCKIQRTTVTVSECSFVLLVTFTF